MAAITEEVETTSYARYDRITSRWGQITMLLALFFSWAGPLYLVFFSDLELSQPPLWRAFAAVAATFGVIWVIEPITYFPVLGPASMYQAFMIGNISNKLLPSAIVAQAGISARPGTRRAEMAAVMAIGGAATIHIVSLLVFVGFLGTRLLSLIPEDIVEVVQLYIFPAIIGAVIVQLTAYVKSVRITAVAFAVALLVQFVAVPAIGGLFASFATAVTVAVTVVLAWLLRDRAISQRPSLPAEPGPIDH